jgi:hypothetical protein
MQPLSVKASANPSLQETARWKRMLDNHRSPSPCEDVDFSGKVRTCETRCYDQSRHLPPALKLVVIQMWRSTSYRRLVCFVAIARTTSSRAIASLNRSLLKIVCLTNSRYTRAQKRAKCVAASTATAGKLRSLYLSNAIQI